MAVEDLWRSIDAELADLQTSGLWRNLRTVERQDPVRARLDGRDVLLFCTNDYLGLSFDPRVIRAAGEATRRWGMGVGASRLISGTMAFNPRGDENRERILRCLFTPYKKTKKRTGIAHIRKSISTLANLMVPSDIVYSREQSKRQGA